MRGLDKWTSKYLATQIERPVRGTPINRSYDGSWPIAVLDSTEQVRTSPRSALGQKAPRPISHSLRCEARGERIPSRA